MTLIAFATYGDHAEFITDTASYTRYVTSMGKTTKHLTLNHIDTAVLTQGNSGFGADVQAGSLQAGGQVANFDEFVETAPRWIREQWEIDSAGHALSESAVFLIGWSDQHSKFTVYALASEDNFQPRRISAPWVIPSPWQYRPSRIELGRARDYMGDDDPNREDFLGLWEAKPVLQAPRSIDEWLDLGKTVREQRALTHFMRVIVAGSLIHTRLDRGSVTTKTIHEFNDAGEEFLQLIAYTQHPQATGMACWCDSGKKFVDCHLAPHMDESCGCGSKKTFRECCSVDASVDIGVGQ
jgi:hypothetical protein